MINPLNLTEMEIDALSEMGNVGTGNAATALSQFLNKNIDMNIPETRFIPLKKFAYEIGGPENIVSSIYLKIKGDFSGEALFMFPNDGALRLVDIIMGREPGTSKEMTEMDESAFKEMSNILTGSFLNSLAKMFDAKLIPSIPHTATDMVQSILDFLLIEVSKHADTVLSVKTKINVEGQDINGEFIVLFEENSLKQILKVLHEKYGT